ncbi:MAG TPA: radical SAM protein [Bacteroidales bacterium]|nr:radical SAM protein [Bacteroidales bacterium]
MLRNTIILHYRNWIIDFLRLAGKLNILRAWNLLQVFIGYYLSKMLRRPVVLGMPYAISAEVAATCNLRCPHCVEGLKMSNRKIKLLPKEDFKQLLSAYKSHALYANLYFQGEPFLNPELPEIVSMANHYGLYTYVSTNGHFLHAENCKRIVEAGLNRIVISLDGLNDETYRFYRVGGNFNKVVDGIATLSKTKKAMNASHPLIVIQFLVNRQNESQIGDLPKFAKSLGADLVEIKTMQLNQEAESTAYLPQNPKYSRYHIKDGKLVLRKTPTKAGCFRLWSHVVFTSDGLLVPCCYDKLPDYPMGNTKGKNLWFSPQMNQFRAKLLTQRSNLDICCNCNE